MDLSEVYDFPLPNQWEQQPVFLEGWDETPMILHYTDTVIRLISLYDGSIWKELKTKEPILKVIECWFQHYGKCLCALLQYSCTIWNGEGEQFSVTLPYRMESIYALEDGLLFERVNDLFSMNTSFSLSSPVRSIPLYFSLHSPLSIPKPFMFKQEIDAIMQSLNYSYEDLSVIGVFGDEIENSHQERELQIISILHPYQLIVFYNRFINQHEFYRYTRTHTNPTSLMQSALDQEEFKLEDPFFCTLNDSEYVLSIVFTGDKMSQPYQKVLCVPSFNPAFVYLYASDDKTTDCFRCEKDALSAVTSFDPINIEWLSHCEGTVVGKVECESMYLEHAVFLQNDREWMVMCEGLVVYHTTHHSLYGQELCIYKNVLYSLTPSSCTLRVLNLHWSELVDKELMLLSTLWDSKQVVLLLQHLLEKKEDLTLANVCSSVSDTSLLRHTLCLLLDHYWVLCDMSSVQQVLRVVNDPSFLFDCYRVRIQPMWYTQVLLQSQPTHSWLPLPFLLYYQQTFHSLTPFQEVVLSFSKVRSILPYPNQILHSSSDGIPPISPLTVFLSQHTHTLPLPNNPTSMESNSSLHQEVQSLLQSKMVNLHLPSETTTVNIPKTIQVIVETQLLSIIGYSLFSLPSQSRQLKEGSIVQLLHNASFHVNTAGRKNQECDVLDCEFSRSFLYMPVIHNTINKAIQIITENIIPPTFSIDNLSFILEDRNEEEQIGVLLALGSAGLLKKIPLSLYKLKCRYCQITQWKENPSFPTKPLNYRLESGYIFALCLSYHCTNDYHVIQLLQYYINALLSLQSTQDCGTLLAYDWRNGGKQGMIQLLLLCILGLGIVCQESHNITILEYLTSLHQSSLAYRPQNLIRYYYCLSVAVGLVMIGETPNESTAVYQHIMQQFHYLNDRLTAKRNPQSTQLLFTGTQCPVEEIPGLLLQIGLISYSANQQTIHLEHPLFVKESSQLLYQFIASSRSDVCLFLGIAYGLTHYCDLTPSLQHLLQTIPSSFHSILTSFPIAVQQETHNEEYQNLLCFLGGLVFIVSIKFAGEMDSSLIQQSIDLVNREEHTLPQNALVIDLIVMFLYHLIHFHHLSYLYVYPRGFILSLLQSLGLFLQGTGDETAVILLRHIIQSTTEKKIASSGDEEWNDVIEVCAISIGLITFGHSTAQFAHTTANTIFLVASFLPSVCPVIDDTGLIPSICRQLFRCCELQWKKEEEKVKPVEKNMLYLPFNLDIVRSYYKESELKVFLKSSDNVLYQNQLELISLCYENYSCALSNSA